MHAEIICPSSACIISSAETVIEAYMYLIRNNHAESVDDLSNASKGNATQPTHYYNAGLVALAVFGILCSLGLIALGTRYSGGIEPLA